MFFSILIFVFGLIVGSFLNCLIYRLALPNFSWKNLRGLRGRSYCPHCRHVLGWQDLIPVLSFFILRRKCRYCGQPISWQYPLVEISTGAVFLLISNSQIPPLESLWLPTGQVISSLVTLALLLFISFLLIVIFVFDLKHYIIPDEITYSAIITTLIYQLLKIANYGLRITDFKQLINPFFSAIGAAAFFLTLVLISKEKWMGLGDVKFAFFMGLLLGWPNILVALFLSFSIGAIIGLGLIIFGKKGWKSEIPFGPFLTVGTFLAMFFGANIVNWYLNLYLL